MITGYQVSRAVYVVSKLAIPDQLAAGPIALDTLAKNVGVKPEALYRVLRALTGMMLFEEPEPGMFGLATAGHLLRSDVQGSLRPLALVHGEEQYESWFEILRTVRTGETGFCLKYGEPFFTYLAHRADVARQFNETMTQLTGMRLQDLLGGYDFSQARLIVDVGGGEGALLAAILRAHRQVTGIVFDLPEVVSEVARCPIVPKDGIRLHFQPGDFLYSVPEGADLYMLSFVLIDWPDVSVLRILQNVRAAMKPDSKLLIYEVVVPPGNDNHFSKFFDLHMMIVMGGKARTEEEHQALLRQARMKLSRKTWGKFGALLEVVPIDEVQRS
jgi:hypothetical protein